MEESVIKQCIVNLKMQFTFLLAKSVEMVEKYSIEISRMTSGKLICHQEKASGLSWLNQVAFREESTLVVSLSAITFTLLEE